MGNGEGDPGGEAATGRTSNIVLDLVSPGVCGAKSRTRLSDFPFTFHFHALEKAMAPYLEVRPSSVAPDPAVNPVDCSPPGSSVPGILQTGILGCVTMPSSRGSS